MALYLSVSLWLGRHSGHSRPIQSLVRRVRERAPEGAPKHAAAAAIRGSAHHFRCLPRHGLRYGRRDLLGDPSWLDDPRYGAKVFGAVGSAQP